MNKLRIPEEISLKIGELINNTAIGELIKISSHSSESSNYISITNSCEEVRMMYSHQTGQKTKLIDEILQLFISLGNLESLNTATDGSISVRKALQSKKHIVHQDYLLNVMNLNSLDLETTLFVDLINDCNYWKDKYSNLEYMPFLECDTNKDGSTNLDSLKSFQTNVVDKINKGNYKTIIIDKIWVITQFYYIWAEEGNVLFEKLNELCNNPDLTILISYERFGKPRDFVTLELYPNLKEFVQTKYERDSFIKEIK